MKERSTNAKESNLIPLVSSADQSNYGFVAGLFLGCPICPDRVDCIEGIGWSELYSYHLSDKGVSTADVLLGSPESPDGVISNEGMGVSSTHTLLGTAKSAMRGM